MTTLSIARVGAALVVALLATQGSADQERPAEPRVVAAVMGEFYFKLVPESEDAEGGGTGYRVREGDDELLYTTHGRFASEVLVSRDGMHIVRVGNWPRTSESNPSDYVALAFYNRGILVKAYMVAELVSDLTKLERSVSHYRYFRSVGWERDPWFGQIRVETVDGSTLLFDLRQESACAPRSSP